VSSPLGWLVRAIAGTAHGSIIGRDMVDGKGPF
jgi:hypothetical protein